MTPMDDGGGTLLKQRPDTTASSPQPPAPWESRVGVWALLVGLVVVSLVALGVWTVSQIRTVDEVVDGPRIGSEHDSLIELRLRERDAARQTQVDPWAQARIREHNRATLIDPWAQARMREQASASRETPLDGWAHTHLREQARAGQADTAPLDPWIQARLREQQR